MRRTAIALAAALAVLVADTAFGHAWFRKNRNGDEVHLFERAPTMDEAAQGVTAVYGISVVQGRKQTVFVEDLADCTAKIPVVGVTGGAAILKASAPATEFVKTQEIEIRGVEPGEAVATITVTGDVSKNCTEQSRNLLVIRVVADGQRADQQFGAEWKRRGRLLRSAIREVGQATRTDILRIGGSIRAGTTDPEVGMAQIYEAAHASLVQNRQLAWNEITAFRTDVVNDLSAGGFSAGDLPKGVALGAGGSWDLAAGGAKLEVSIGASYLGETLGKLRAGFDKDAAKSGDGGISFFSTVYDAGLPALHPPALGSTLPDPASKLGIDLVSGFAIPYEMGGFEGYTFVGGFYDPARGAPELSVLRAGGAPIPVNVTTGSGGTWSATAGGLAPGFPYAFRLQYAGGADSCDFPFTIPNLLQF